MFSIYFCVSLRKQMKLSHNTVKVFHENKNFVVPNRNRVKLHTIIGPKACIIMDHLWWWSIDHDDDVYVRGWIR